jgi:glutamyl-tRNA reductase
VQHNSAQRTAALAKAQTIVDFHVGQFSLERSRRQYAPQIQNFRSHIDAIRQQEISHAMRAFKNAEHISAAQLEAALQQMSRRFMNKVLHQPTIGLRSDHPTTRDAWQTATRTWLNDTSEQ